MGIVDPFVVKYYERRETWIIMRGRETFYNDNDEMLEFETAQEAAAHALAFLGANSVRLETEHERKEQK